MRRVVVGGITTGQAITWTLSDGKKIRKVTEVVTGTESVVRAVSFSIDSIMSVMRCKR
jgi:hypothetical protein